MTDFRSPFLQLATERGYVHQCTDFEGLDHLLADHPPVSAYIGFDCTAPGLHVGSLLQVMLLRHLQRSGHRPIVLIGGGTTRVGDPSGKDESRRLLDDETIAANAAGIQSVFERFLTFGDGPTDAIMVDNQDWLGDLKYVDFLRTVGRHFSVNRMLTFDSVRLRLEREQPLSFLEFNYMILQAFDFTELAHREGCVLQMGGSDQWGNIVNGVELARRLDGAGYTLPPLFGLTSPLVTTASGEKMGKTARGAVWLNASMRSPYDYWQFWRNAADADIGRFLRLFTELPLDEIHRLEALRGQEANVAKIRLANEATRLAHGDREAERAEATAQATFEQGGTGEALPTILVPAKEFDAGMSVVKVFARDSVLASTNGEARRLIRGGGARVNDVKVIDENRTLGPADLVNGEVRLSAGRKRHAVLRPVRTRDAN
ncbi:MAG: tyrosine--tRNA ligase [Rhodospirillales bacterium]|nr:tyrosine--tRNA ligase [Rhodospirillales bacterium]